MASAVNWHLRYQGLVRKEDSVRLRLSVGPVTTTEAELRSLHAWLLADSQARRCADVRWDAAAQAPVGGMGPLLDVVSLVIGSGFSAASLAVSIVQWRSTRGAGAPSVTVEQPDGRRVTINDMPADEAERLLRSLFGARPEERGRS
ncbi:effector-associated constant component EACC1 [Streptomyces parvulus]|uniref:effector-associated constant component EACC1 n=1 Tax=Streptomyces parvulus TaxID=146923 RepID=UPI0033DFF480